MELNNIIISSPVQSLGLQAENIPIPNDIRMNDINNPQNMVGLKRAADEYKIKVDSKRHSSNTITVEDVESAETYRLGANIADVMPKFVVPMQQVAIDTMVTRLTEVFNARFDAIDIRLNGIDTLLNANQARIFNVTATHDNDLLQIPAVGVGNTDGFPTTLGELKALPINHGELCHRIEDYFSFPHTGSIVVRRKRIQRAYGVGYTSVQLV